MTEPVDHSECPTWDTRNNVLYFVNIHQGEIYRYTYETGDIRHIQLNGEIAPVIPSKDNPNLLIAGLNRSVVAVEWDGESIPSHTRILTTLSRQFPTSRVNDGKADIEGRLWIGTMGYEDASGVAPNEGALYEVTCSNLISPDVKVSPVNISNGMAFNKANDKAYYIDTPTRQIVGYSYDQKTGDISDKFVVFDVNDYNSALTGNPDGMTIDSDDNLWIALYGGWAVIHVNSSSGALIQVIEIPAEDVTSTMFGGPDLDILYVTTSRVALTDEQKEQQPLAGSVFEVTGLGVKGVPMFGVGLLKSIDDDVSYKIF